MRFSSKSLKSRLASQTIVAAVALLSVAMFCWPLFIAAPNAQQSTLAQALFIALMPLLLALTIAEFASGQLNSRQIAVLGVLIALNSAIRMLGAGTSGIETAFFLIVISSYALGSGFGYLMGAGSLLVSGLITGGVGPWLPFQMMAAGILGYLTGMLPKSSHRNIRLAWLSFAAVVGSYLYGALMTMWNWPFLAGVGSSISYVPGDGLATNLAHFLAFEVATGGILWDTGRAVTTLVLIWLTAPALLATLDRASRRAGF